MKFCTQCGSQLADESKFCQNCGATAAPVQSAPAQVVPEQAAPQPICNVQTVPAPVPMPASESAPKKEKTAVKVLGIIARVYSMFALYTWSVVSLLFLLFGIPPFWLGWIIPMTILAFRKVGRRTDISVGFCVCMIIFVDTTTGVLLLVRRGLMNKD